MKRTLQVYDYETLGNFFSGAFIGPNEADEPRVFVIHQSRDDRQALYEFLYSNIVTVGYNSYDFDRHITQFLLLNRARLLQMTPHDCAVEIKRYANVIIEERPYIKDKELIVPDLDLMRIWHFDPFSARATSLKALQFKLKWHKLQDMPLPHDHFVKNNEVDQIIQYNINDILSTREWLLHSDTQKKIKMRREIKNIYGIDVFNKPDASIGQDIIIEEIAKRTGQSKWDLSKMRTHRESINLDECILPYVNFRTPVLQNLLSELRSKTITQTKGALKYSIPFGGLVLTFGTGGLHAVPCIKQGSSKNPYKSKPLIRENSDTHELVLVDVSSYYPNLSIKNQFYAEHFGPVFCTIYEEIYQTRLKYKKEGNKILDGAYKLALNGAFGKSNDKYSPLYDSKLTMLTTLNGQLLLTMLIEDIYEKDIELIQANTDGILVYIEKSKLPELRELCNAWEDMTGLKLDFDYFDKLVQADVNNYMARYNAEKMGFSPEDVAKNKHIKSKGRFETIKDWHKDHSAMIIPKAVNAYFFDNIPIEETIRNHTDIFDFFIIGKVTKPWYLELRYINTEGNYQVDKLQKTNRYYISKQGGTLMKCNPDGRELNTHVNYKAIIMNEFISMEIENYNINYQYYITKAQNEINHILNNNQQTLF